jgi:hypothetical protein
MQMNNKVGTFIDYNTHYINNSSMLIVCDCMKMMDNKLCQY